MDTDQSKVDVIGPTAKDFGSVKSFLSLPIELRCNIYTHYFASIPNTRNYRLVQGDTYCGIYCLKGRNTQILTVNRQLHDEARKVLYRESIWHLGFLSNSHKGPQKPISDGFLRAFASAPQFPFIQNVTVGVIFHTFPNPNLPQMQQYQDRISQYYARLRINRKLLELICQTLLQAAHLRTLNLLWHDQMGYGNWEQKRNCLQALATLPENVTCRVYLRQEADSLHSHANSANDVGPTLSVQEQAAKADLNQYLDTVRQQHQARLRQNSPAVLDNTPLSAIEQSST